jgi:2,3-bisphosphoglycerate-dependent phosphoglycerate mutase
MSRLQRRLILVRHGQSEGNLHDIFTGWDDRPLTALGKTEARYVGSQLKSEGLHIDIAFASALQRAWMTCEIILGELCQPRTEIVRNPALNERNYGLLTGLKKGDAREKWGESQIAAWRRSFYECPPNGESLRDTVARVLPYYVQEILPHVLRGETALIVAHGNSLRALLMTLDRLTPDAVSRLEIATGEVCIYRMTETSEIDQKRILRSQRKPDPSEQFTGSSQ